jgi:hypothetical protein
MGAVDASSSDWGAAILDFAAAGVYAHLAFGDGPEGNDARARENIPDGQI